MTGMVEIDIARPQVRTQFWDKVIDGPNGCRVWASARPGGYGGFVVDGVTYRAHRFAWTLAHGPILDGLLVCHHCDNPPCVNVAHLFLGTHRDNVADMDAKGRRSGGKGSLPPPRMSPIRRMMTVTELTTERELSERLIRRHVAGGSIPYYKIGGRVLFDLSEIDAWIAAHKVEQGGAS